MSNDSATISSVEELVAVASVEVATLTENSWWRGQAAAWPLSPSVRRRSGSTLERERELATRFMRGARTRYPGCPARHEWASWLFLMQHYGLRTRLLDWTEAPLVAAFFAVDEAGDADGVIWLLNPFDMNASLIGGENVVYTADSPKVVQLFSDVFEDEEMGTAPSEGVAAIGPDEVDLRMMLQHSVFTIHGAATPLDQLPNSAAFLRGWTIPQAAKRHIRAQLSILGIRRSTLFPDLKSLAGDLDNYEFGKAVVARARAIKLSDQRR
jgi:FRG domain